MVLSFTQYDCLFELSVTETSVGDANANNSVVSYSLRATKLSTTSSSGGVTVSASVNGASIYNSVVLVTTGPMAVNLASNSVTIAHNNDGSKSIALVLNSQSGTMPLTEIDRWNWLTSYGGNITLGSAFTFSIGKRMSGSTTKLLWQIGNSSRTELGTVSGTSATYTLPTSIANNYITTSMGKTGYIYLYTYLNGTDVGHSAYPFTFTVPSYTPTLTLGASNHADSYTSGSTWLTNISKLSQVYTASTSYGASWSVAFNISNGVGTGSSSSSPYVPANKFTSAGTATISATLSDSRGKTVTASKTLTITSIATPTVSLSGGRYPNASGTNYRVVCSGTTYSSGTYILKKNGTQIYTTTSQNLSYNATGSITLADTASFVLTVTDNYGQTAEVVLNVPKGTVYIDCGGGSNETGVAIGGVSSGDVFDEYLPADFKSTTNFASLPTVAGSAFPYPSQMTMVRDGSAATSVSVSSSTYKLLYVQGKIGSNSNFSFGWVQADSRNMLICDEATFAGIKWNGTTLSSVWSNPYFYIYKVWGVTR